MTTAQDVIRREAIAAYGILDGARHDDLDNLVRLAASVCDVPKAVINIIDDRFQHQIAAVGFQAGVCSREDSMCAKVFEQPGHIVLSDAREDARFVDNPFVTGEVANVRFYASSPIITPDGVPIGTLCVFDDATGELTEDEDRSLRLLARQIVDVLELRRLTRELERSNSELGTFAGRVAHDLRNPLTALSGFLELALDDPALDELDDVRDALERVDSAAGRMGVMLSDLLDFARFGGANPQRIPVQLAEVAAAAQQDLHAAVTETGAQVEVLGEATVSGDPTLLTALLQNLLANAIKFAAASGAQPHVIVAIDRIEGGVRLVVDDNGPGVPSEERELVFELMRRGRNSEAPGLGIGLSTCRRIAESQGAVMGIEDAALGGARVWVVFADR